MNAQARNSWGVEYSAISFFERALFSHNRVAQFERTNDIFFIIERDDGLILKALLVDEYTLGLAAVLRACEEFPDLDYVVTCANWNGYTQEAKDYGEKNDIGIFVVGEFLGALYWRSPKEYVKKDEEGNPVSYVKPA